MKSAGETLRIRFSLMLGAMFLFSVWMETAGSVEAQDADRRGQQALQDQGELPWYDEETDSVRFVDLPENATSPTDNPNQGKQGRKRQPEENRDSSGSGLGSGGSVGGSGVASFLFWGIVILIIVLFAGGLLWAFIKMESKDKNDSSVVSIDQPSKEARVEKLPFQINRPTGDLLSTARQFFAQGDYGNAIIHLYSHVLISLDEKDLIRLTRGKTNRQYLREVQRHEPIADYLESCMIPFEEALFGGRQVQQTVVGNCLQQFDQFKNTLTQTSAVG